MKFLNASVSIIPIPIPSDTMGVYQHLERIGRTCYKSEDKITDESCLKFLQNIFNRKHWAMLEHYPFVIEDINGDLTSAMESIYEINDINVQSKIPFIKTSICMEDRPNNGFYDRHLISGSATAFNYLMEALQATDMGDVEARKCYMEFMKMMNIKFSCIFKDPYPSEYMYKDTYEELSEKYRLLSQDDVLAIKDPAASIHLYMTARFICDRGVTHEIVRHRPASYAQESTRYCNYGGSGCQFIIPEWFTDNEVVYLRNTAPDTLYSDIVIDKKPKGFRESAWYWVKTMHIIDQSYANLVDPNRCKWQPQQARSVLPNSVKTEIVMTANLPEWVHFFNMRVPKTAHPQMREVSIPLYYAAREIYGDRLPNLDAEAEGTPARVK